MLSGNRSAGESGDKEMPEYEKSIFFYHPDHLGSTTIITNFEGEITQSVAYVPYGEVFIEERSGVRNTPYLFNAKELDEETGLYYYGARYLDPTLSLWQSVDPLFEKYAGISPYNYCLGNPVELVDPDGTDVTIDGENQSFVTFKTDLIDIHIDASSLGVDWGGQYTLDGETVLSAALDIVGIFDPTGVADAINAGIQAKNGEYMDAAVSVIGLVPYVGDAAKIFKVKKDVKVINTAIDAAKSEKKALHRPYIRKSTKEGVPELPKGADGRYIDPRDGKSFDGNPDLGHKPGHEFWREKQKTESEGLTQKQFNDRMNDSKLYQRENPSLNRSHKYEKRNR